MTLLQANREDQLRYRVFEPSRRVTLQNGIPLEKFCAATEVPLIGAEGRFDCQKQFNLLIDTMPALLLRQPKSRLFLLLVGSEDLEAKLREQATAFGVGANVQLLGHRVDGPECLAAFDLLGLPALVESQPLALMEGMAAHTAIVAARLDAFSEMDAGSGASLSVDPTRTAEFAGAMATLLEDAAGRAEMGAAGRLRSRHYSSASNVERTCALYAQIWAEQR